MFGVPSFTRGGIRPLSRKSATRGQAIWNAAIPSISIVALRQHPGPPATTLVSRGARVREGQMIGRSDHPLSAHVHSPVPGVVQDLREITLPDGTTSPAVVIELGGEFDLLGKAPARREWHDRPAEELLGDIADAGVVGMGGSMVPAETKYRLPDHPTVDALVINGAECEPFVTAEHRLMAERASDVVDGIRMLQKILNPNRVIIGIQRDKADAAEALSLEAGRQGLAYAIETVPVVYPQGDEKQMVRTLLGREVPSQGSTLDVGAMVVNVSTVVAVFEAIAHRKPLFERVVTVAGGAIRRPGNLKVRIGMTVGELIQECGGLVGMPARIVFGGPLRGIAIDDMNTPILKGTSAVLALRADEIHDAQQTACIQCGRCVRSCPMGLQPIRLVRLLDHRRFAEATTEGLPDCQECGVCSFVCPAHIPLTQSLAHYRRLVAEQAASGSEHGAAEASVE